MKSNRIFISICLFVLASTLTSIFSHITGRLYDELFHPNYGWWGSAEFVTIPLLYCFFTVFLFTLWGGRKYYYPMLICLFPVWFLLLMSIISGFTNNDFDLFSKIFVLPGVIAFLVAKLIRFIVSKFKHSGLPTVVK